MLLPASWVLNSTAHPLHMYTLLGAKFVDRDQEVQEEPSRTSHLINTNYKKDYYIIILIWNDFGNAYSILIAID